LSPIDADTNSLDSYKLFFNHLAESEIGTARNKKTLLVLANLGRLLNSKVPWQVNRWSAERARQFRENDPKFQLPITH